MKSQKQTIGSFETISHDDAKQVQGGVSMVTLASSINTGSVLAFDPDFPCGNGLPYPPPWPPPVFSGWF